MFIQLCVLVLLKVAPQKLFTLAWLVRSPAFLPTTSRELRSVVVTRLQGMTRFRMSLVFLMTCQGTKPLSLEYVFSVYTSRWGFLRDFFTVVKVR